MNKAVINIVLILVLMVIGIGLYYLKDGNALRKIQHKTKYKMYCDDDTNIEYFIYGDGTLHPRLDRDKIYKHCKE